MNHSLRERVRRRLEVLDQWDDGGRLVLARDAGGDIISYTGTQGWNAGAGHRSPTIDPVLHQLLEEIQSELHLVEGSFHADLERRIASAERAFRRNSSSDSLMRYAELVDFVCPLYVGGNGIRRDHDKSDDADTFDDLLDLGRAAKE